MSEPSRLAVAFRFAAEKHEGQTRVGGAPYVTHPIAVAEILSERGYGEDYQIAALFHDLLEDTDATEEEILQIGGERVLRAVRLLTKKKGYVMADYIAGIRADEMALAVKLADRLHNLRCAVLCDRAFRAKYVAESEMWYAPLDEEVARATEELKETLEG